MSVNMISYITISTNDLQKVKSFYEKVFEFVVEKESSEFIFYKLNNLTLVFYSKYAMEKFLGIKTESISKVLLSANLDSEEEVNLLYERAKLFSTKILTPPRDSSLLGYHFFLEDVESNPWEIVYNSRSKNI